jgi:hypothetical protein
MYKYFITLICLGILLSYFPLLFSQWWHIHSLWAAVSFWFLSDLMLVGSDLRLAEERIKDLKDISLQLSQQSATHTHYTEIVKLIKENDLLLVEIRTRLMHMQRHLAEQRMPRSNSFVSSSYASSLASNSLSPSLLHAYSASPPSIQ